jgi:hypothetical protein
VGSHDINGNNRYLFDETCVYLGLDVCPGDNVDIVMPVHELYLAGNPFGVIISTEAFEHDMYITDSLPRICNILLQPRGLFMFTCGTTGCREHGTNKVHPELSGTSKIDSWKNYYHNLTEEEIRAIVNVDKVFAEYGFSVVGTSLQFWGIKK